MSPEEELDLRTAEPEDDGSIVQIKVAYPESPKTYIYAAIRFDGWWYLSGVANTARRTWDDMITFFKNRNIEVLSIKLVTAMEDLL